MAFRIIFLASLFTLHFSDSFGVQDQIDDIAWYDQFFKTPHQNTPEADIAAANARLNKAIEADNLEGHARALNEMGLIHLARLKDYEKSLDYFIEALTLEDSLKLTRQQVFTYMGIAQVFFETGDLSKSNHFLEQSLTLQEGSGSAAIRVRTLNQLGVVNAELGKADEAMQYYQQALEYHSELGDPSIEAETLYNLAHLHTIQKEYEKALDYHKQSLALRRSAADRNLEAVSLNDIGTLYASMKNGEKSLANHVVALEIRQSLKDKKGIAESYNNIGIHYFQAGNIERAIANLQLALQAARESQDQAETLRSYDYLNQCHKKLGDFKSALEYAELSLALSEFVQHERDEKKLVEVQNRYVIDQQEARIGRLETDRIQRERQIESQKRIQNLLMILIAFGVVIILLTLYLYWSKRRSNRILEAANKKVQEQNLQLTDLNATKDKFFSIISHDLKGPLNSLTSFSGLLINHLESLTKEEIQMLAKDLDKSLKNLFALLENLLEWSRSQTGNIDFKRETFDVTLLLNSNAELLKTQAGNKNITIINDVKSPAEVIAHKHSVNTVIRNLISNAIKFTPYGGEVTLGLSGNSDEFIFSVKDTGVGMPPEVLNKLFRIDVKHSTKGTADEKGTGLGLILCKEFIEKNGGRIWADSTMSKGSKFSFALPKANVKVNPANTIVYQG